jgi:hypothetical protein
MEEANRGRAFPKAESGDCETVALISERITSRRVENK